MKKIVLGFFILMGLLPHGLFAQKMPSDYFDEGGSSFEEKDYGKAISSFQYIVDHHPKSELYPKAFYNVGYIQFENEQYDKAIPVFKAILVSNFNETEGLGGGIMDDPYANFRHRASELLCNIYMKKKMYDTALYYFAMSDTLYPYLHFCGNELEANCVYTALKYVELYEKLDQPDKEIGALMKAAFVTLDNNSAVLSDLKSLLKKKKGVKKEFDAALDNMYAKEYKRGDAEYKIYYFRFMNSEVEVPGSYVSSTDKFDKEEVLKNVHESDFYKMIRKL